MPLIWVRISSSERTLLNSWVLCRFMSKAMVSAINRHVRLNIRELNPEIVICLRDSVLSFSKARATSWFVSCFVNFLGVV